MTEEAIQPVVHGIDFGTSTSMIMVGRPGVRELLIKDPLAAHGEVGIPTSVCARPDGGLAVGYEAENTKELDILGYRTGFKVNVGKPMIDRLGGVDYSPDGLMAAVIGFLRDCALAVVPVEPSAVVLTVPVAWEEWTRGLAVQACAAAGYDPALVHLEDEPVAAMAGLGPLTGKTVIYDLGGGTFDCAVAMAADGGPRIYGAPGGLPHVGGRAFDERVLRHVRESYPQAAKLFPPDDPGADVDVLRRLIGLRERCVEVKIALSLVESTRKLLSQLDPAEIFGLDRTDLAGLIGDLVEETVEECERMLSALGLSFSEIDQILQIGGSSRIPLSRERLRTRSGCTVQLVEEPDLAVVRGATELALRIAVPPKPDQDPEREAQASEPDDRGDPGAEAEPTASPQARRRGLSPFHPDLNLFQQTEQRKT